MQGTLTWIRPRPGRRFAFRKPFRQVADARPQRAALAVALALMAAMYYAELVRIP